MDDHANRPAAERTKGGAPPSFTAFTLRLLLYLFLVSLLFSLGGLHTRMEPVQKWIARAAGAGANLFGAEATVTDTIIRLDRAALEINHECTGVFVLLVYAMFVLAYPAPWQQRLSGVILGATLLTAVNVGRLVALTWIASQKPALFAYFHEYFFQGVFVALLAFLASVWTEQVRRATLRRVSA
jgi:archaeosortase B (VPXXXP-CTERM-specific)